MHKETCTQEADLVWLEANELYGPSKAGWSISLGPDTLMMISYCPWCGVRLPDHDPTAGFRQVRPKVPPSPVQKLPASGKLRLAHPDTGVFLPDDW